MIGLIDTHTHLFCEEFDSDRELAIIRAKEAGVTRMFMPNIDDESIDALLKLCDKTSGCYPLMGLHPTSVADDWKIRLEKVEKVLISGRKFYGIGEVGLDLYWDKTYVEEQKEVFRIQLRIPHYEEYSIALAEHWKRQTICCPTRISCWE